MIAFSVTPKADSYRPDEESAKSSLAEEESAQSAINSCGNRNKAMQESYSAKCACITVAPAKVHGF